MVGVGGRRRRALEILGGIVADVRFPPCIGLEIFGDLQGQGASMGRGEEPSEASRAALLHGVRGSGWRINVSASTVVDEQLASLIQHQQSAILCTTPEYTHVPTSQAPGVCCRELPSTVELKISGI